jgi:hypothetical protein
VRAVFDAPVPAPPGKQLQGMGLRAWHAGDGIFDLQHVFAIAVGRACQPAGLLQSWPIRLVNQPRGGL